MNDREKLIRRAQKRDHDAFTELMKLHMKDMYRAAIAILMNDEDAADAVQDTILACWEKLSGLRDPAVFRTWMTRILIRKCYDIRRQRGRTVDIAEYEEPPANDGGYNLELKEALDLLEEKYRLPIMLFYGLGYKTAEIAEMLHIPKSTVQTRLARGREQLSNYYGAEKEQSYDRIQKYI